MSETKRLLKVFLCHASADKPKVRELYRALKRRGVQPWLDAVDLIPGQNWEAEIPKALYSSDAIIICLTPNSVDKEGYVQKEIKFALDKTLEMPDGRIFLIPAKLEECEMPFSLQKYQAVNLYEKDGYTKLMKALKLRAYQLERSTVNLPKSGELAPKVGAPIVEAQQPERIRNLRKPNTATLAVLIGLAGIIIAGLLVSPYIGNLFVVSPTLTNSPTPTLGPTPTFTLHPDAIGPIQTLTALAGAINALEEANMTQPIQQTLTSVANTIEILGMTATKAADTPTPGVTPLPLSNSYIPLLVFDQNLNGFDSCWMDEPNERDNGFDRRADGGWKFGIESGRSIDDFIQADFSQCLDIQEVRAIALNAWVVRLELERDYPEVKEPGKEFGFFIEDTNGERREYTIWIDATESMHLKVREGSETTLDEIISIVNIGSLKIRGAFPRLYSEFPIQFYFELDNNGVDILYLKQGLAQAVAAESLDPSQMIRIDNAVRPTTNGIKKIGLIGYGGETQVILWPFAFLGE